jgi:hypothetical protein
MATNTKLTYDEDEALPDNGNRRALHFKARW